MAQHQDNCEICRRLEECRAGTHPGLICETETGFAVLGDSQYFRGYCLLLCKTPATELDELSPAVRLKYLEEMALLAQAVREVVQPHKLNYECLGNLVHHLHWHVFPRQLSEASPEKPVWQCMPSPEEAARFALDPARDGELISQLRVALKRLLAAKPHSETV
jgi:diadenosine tetraphosphate (Ap4A) HIT family hydrolase